MTSKLDFVKEWTSHTNIVEANETYFSDDFQSVDKDGNVVMDKQGYLAFVRTMLAALPDLKWVPAEFREEGDVVIMSGHFEGTFTNDLDLSAMGTGVIPASGKKIMWPQMSVSYQVEGDKIVKEIPYGDVSGFEDFLAPLGVKAPSVEA
jgi:predicted ester cyclase